ncbi:Flp pilus assembly protein CpaB [Isoptericola sp. NEAU-Y5]|uniref:Flp pilus assembly protein CpaB n=1 Tax=Isoptericola luteus TaxID=2879484 RepID=A0ABS7ZGG9_9MICO|nr:Flp pilus assembly protein CpaB [Isoptericola sp. NEAU-Y5]MCA5892954.1 Flp pilus assembly protein CpaB [Isoptericola sp. NEAU-Y5]
MPDRTARRSPALSGAAPRDLARRRARRRWRTLAWRSRHVAAAVCCGLAAAVVVQALRPAPPTTVDVVVPAHRLAAGESLRPDDLTTRTVPAALVPADVLTDADDAVGRAPAVALPAGLPLHPDLLPGGGAVAQAPDGTVVVPVRLDQASAGWLRPGDRVDLLALGDGSAEDTGGDDAYLARRALVLPGPGTDDHDAQGVGGLLGAGSSAGAVEVTLVAVSPDDAPRLSTASGWGTIGAVLVR